MPNLGEVSHCSVRIRNKLKTILRRGRKRRFRRRRCHVHGHFRGQAFDEFPPESGAVSESAPPGDTRPLNAKRTDDSAYKSECLVRIKTVRHDEHVEYVAHVR